MDWSHEPTRLVGADRQHHEIERAETFTDFFECWMQASVAGEQDPHAIRLNDPTAPQRFVAITDPARTEMLRGHAGGVERRGIDRLPPVALDHRPNAIRVQQFAQSQRTEPQRLRGSARNPANRTGIEMVVVIVREQDHIDWRERVEVESGRHQSARTEPLKGRRAFAPDRIGEDVHWPELQQRGRVADPRDGSMPMRRARGGDRWLPPRQ